LLASAEAPAPSDWQRRTSAGYTVRLRRADQGPDELLELVTPDGPLCLTIRLAKDGPCVEIHGAELHLHAEKRLRLEGERVEILAHTNLELRSDGAIQQHAAGAVTSAAFEHQLESTHGEIRLIANDDVAVEGERIRLNSPMTPLPKHLKTPAGNA
jgi:transcription elongation GreA/GreB family factor